MSIFQFNKFRLILLIFLLGGPRLAAQSPQATQAGLRFEQLDPEARRKQVQSWMNESMQIDLPAEAAQVARNFYGPDATGEILYRKNRLVLAPLFNSQLSTGDRLGYCNYLLQHFTEEEIPLDLVRTCKRELLNPVNR